jgi:4-hydroxy-3-polyprenylbenzoate decarboxylase
MNLGSKMVIDAQSHARRAGSAGVEPDRPRDALPAVPPVSGDVADPRAFDPGVLAHRLAWGGLLAVQVRGDGRAVVERLIQRPEYAGIRLLAAVSDDVPLADDELLIWGIFTRFDCARDLVPARTESRGALLACRGPLGIDATWKAGYPNPVANLPEVIEKVSGWWCTPIEHHNV